MVPVKPWPTFEVGRLILGILVCLAFGVSLAGLTSHWTRSLDKSTSRLVLFLVQTLSFQGMILVLTHLFLKQVQMSWKEAFGLFKDRIGKALLVGMAWGFIVVIIALQLGWISSQLLNWLGLESKSQEVVQMLQESMPGWHLIFFGSIAIILVPIAEEVLFRGILYPTVKQSGRPRLALWGVSFLFALTHANLMAILPLTFVAVVLTLLYEETNHLAAPIAAHSLFNAFNFFLVLAIPHLQRWSQW